MPVVKPREPMRPTLNGIWFRLFIALVPLYAGLGWTLWSHSIRLSVIEANRFTQAEGIAMSDRIQEVKLQIAALPQELPPKWFITRVDVLDARLTAFEAKLERNLQEILTSVLSVKQGAEKVK